MRPVLALEGLCPECERPMERGWCEPCGHAVLVQTVQTGETFVMVSRMLSMEGDVMAINWEGSLPHFNRC